jgi:hypothetical protein
MLEAFSPAYRQLTASLVKFTPSLPAMKGIAMQPLVVSVYLIRKNAEQSTDDRIYIRSVSENLLSATYHDNDVTKTYTLYMDSDELDRYILSIADIFTSDTDPFEKIQFNFNGYPTFMLSKDSFDTRQTRHMLKTVSRSIMRSLLLAETVPKPQALQSVAAPTPDPTATVPIACCGYRSCSFDSPPALQRTDNRYWNPIRNDDGAHSPRVESHY